MFTFVLWSPPPGSAVPGSAGSSVPGEAAGSSLGVTVRPAADPSCPHLIRAGWPPPARTLREVVPLPGGAWGFGGGGGAFHWGSGFPVVESSWAEGRPGATIRGADSGPGRERTRPECPGPRAKLWSLHGLSPADKGQLQKGSYGIWDRGSQPCLACRCQRRVSVGSSGCCGD